MDMALLPNSLIKTPALQRANLSFLHAGEMIYKHEHSVRNRAVRVRNPSVFSLFS